MDEHLQPLLRELLGDALRRERHRQGRTLAQISAASGVSIQHLSDVERGRKDPSSEVLAAITGALAIDVLDLLRRIEASATVAPVLDLTGHAGSLPLRQAATGLPSGGAGGAAVSGALLLAA